MLLLQRSKCHRTLNLRSQVRYFRQAALVPRLQLLRRQQSLHRVRHLPLHQLFRWPQFRHHHLIRRAQRRLALQTAAAMHFFLESRVLYRRRLFRTASHLRHPPSRQVLY